MSWRLRWLIVTPVVLFVAGSLLMSSCGGGGSSCSGTFDEFGDFLPGVCPSPGPGVGFNLEEMVIGAGTPVAETPTPSPSPSRTPIPSRTPTPSGPTPTPSPSPTPSPAPTPTEHVGKATPTATQTLVPMAGPTLGVVGQPLAFNASGLFVKFLKSFVADITNRKSTLWTSSDSNVILPPAPPPMGGIYQPLRMGCACIDASSGGIAANPVVVAVVPNLAATPLPCPVCPTIAPTPTSTPRGQAPQEPSARDDAAGGERRAQPGVARIKGVLQWNFEAVSPVASQLVPSSDGNLYFLTADGDLHVLSAKGRERWRRPAAGQSIAVSPDGTLYALGTDGTLQARSPNGKPRWSMTVDSAVGPLAASSRAVYFQEGRQLFAASSPGVVLWRATAPDEITSAAIAEDGSVIAAANGASVIAVAPDGTRRWSFTPPGGFAGAIAIRGDIVYLGSGGGRIYALDASTGSQQWSYDTAAAVVAGPVVNAAGPIFFSSDAIYALNSNGSIAWSKTLTKPASSPLASDGEGGVFAPLDDDLSAMLNSDGSSKWITGSIGPVDRAIVSPSGMLYVATQGTIYAIR
jgi:outer membrane protein assembly factor BamB